MGDGHAFGKHVVLCMQNKAAVAVDRTAYMDRVIDTEAWRADIQFFIEVAKIEP